MVRLVQVTKKNLPVALKTAYSIFHGKKDRALIKKWYRIFVNKESGKHNVFLRYFIAYDGKEPVGITGIYQFKGDPDVWLGFFGVVKEKRRKGVGSEILLETIKQARHRGAKHLRLYTISKRASAFYEKNGFKKTAPQKWLIVKGKKIFKYPPKSNFYAKKLR